MKAWLFQDHRQKKKLGDKCPWSVGWIDPEGNRKSKSIGSHSNAEKYQRKIEGQLAAGTYNNPRRKQWSDFRTEYEEKILKSSSAGNRMSAGIAFDHFERVCKVKLLFGIRTNTIDGYKTDRAAEDARKGCKVSPATVNKELRHIRAALRKAKRWGYLPEVPDFAFLREPEKHPTYVTPEHFAAIFNNSKVATEPSGLSVTMESWWKALLVFLYLTGWRIGEALALKKEDVDLKAGTAITRHTDNKGKREDSIQLPAFLIEHLEQIQGAEQAGLLLESGSEDGQLQPLVFPWFEERKELYTQFHAIQKAANIHLPCREVHEHTEGCHLYGFHDLRRAFATMNAANLTADALQRLMRHRSYSTTQRYVNMARQLKGTAEKIFVPDVSLPAAKKAN